MNTLRYVLLCEVIPMNTLRYVLLCEVIPMNTLRYVFWCKNNKNYVLSTPFLWSFEYFSFIIMLITYNARPFHGTQP